MDHRGDFVRKQLVRATACLGLVGALACGPDLPEPTAEPTATPTAQAEPAQAQVPVVRLRLTPRDPVPGDIIVPQIDVKNADDDDITYAYVWRLNGQRAGTGNSFKVAKRTNDALIELQVTAHTKTQSSDPVTAHVRVGNRIPTVTSLAIHPSLTPTVVDSIRVLARGEDPDDDPIDFVYHWRVNGSHLREGGSDLPADRFRRGDKIEVDVIATDGNAESEPMSSPMIVIINSPPVIVSSPAGLNADGSFAYSIEVEDADDRMMRYALVESPAGMTINWLGGEIQWQPNEKQGGKHKVKVEVDDQNGGKTVQEFSLDVAIEEIDKPGLDANGQPVAAIDPGANADELPAAEAAEDEPDAFVDEYADEDVDEYAGEDVDEYADEDRIEEAADGLDDPFEEESDGLGDPYADDARDDRFDDADDLEEDAF